MGKEIRICFNKTGQQCTKFQFSENWGEVLERHKCSSRLLKWMWLLSRKISTFFWTAATNLCVHCGLSFANHITLERDEPLEKQNPLTRQPEGFESLIDLVLSWCCIFKCCLMTWGMAQPCHSYIVWTKFRGLKRFLEMASISLKSKCLSN